MNAPTDDATGHTGGRATPDHDVRIAWGQLCAAMVRADTGALDDLLDEDFTLTHMTGYVQPRQEWLTAVESGEMRYHSIDDVDVRVEPDLHSGGATLTARTRTLATIWGSRSTWNLRLHIRYAQRDGRWVAREIVASLW